VPTYSLTVEYDGTDFAGWQIQPRVRTAMGTLHDALLTVTGETPALTAAGRTDAGAHAHGQVVGCTLERAWAPDSLRHALNATLPQDLAVRDAAVQPETFNARRDAVERTYRYLIVCRDGHAPVTRRNAWAVRGPLDVDAMRTAAAYLVGRHDFAAFGSSPRDGGSTVRNVTGVSVEEVVLSAPTPGMASSPAPRTARVDTTGVETTVTGVITHDITQPILDTIIITVHADAFLRGMMRSFTGALVKIGRGRATPEWLASLLDSATQRDPRLTIAPARGLHQWAVRYPQMDSTHQELAA
jgi:tRNA pseudouridine38-40 synthase